MEWREIGQSFRQSHDGDEPRQDSRSRLSSSPPEMASSSVCIRQKVWRLLLHLYARNSTRSRMLYPVQSLLSDRSTSLRQHFPFTLLKKCSCAVRPMNRGHFGLGSLFSVAAPSLSPSSHPLRQIRSCYLRAMNIARRSIFLLSLSLSPKKGNRVRQPILTLQAS